MMYNISILKVAGLCLCLLPLFTNAHEEAGTPLPEEIVAMIKAGSKAAAVDSAAALYLAGAAPAEALELYYRMGNAYRKAQPLRAAALLDQATALQLRQEVNTAKAFLAKGLLYAAASDYGRARHNYEQAIEVLEALGNSGKLLAACYKNLGKIYTRLGDYSRAIELFEKDLLLGLGARDSIKDYIELANIYELTNEPERAILYYEQALTFEGIEEVQRAVIHANLADMWLARGQAAKAGAYLQQAMNVFEALHQHYPQEAAYYLYSTCMIAGNRYLLQKSWQQAALAYGQAMAYAREAFGGEGGREMAKIHYLNAQLAIAQKQYEQALGHCDEALKCLIPSFEPAGVATLPPARDLYPENALMEVFSARAEALEGMYEQTLEPELLKAAYACYPLLMEVEDLFRKNYESEGSELLLANENHLHSEVAIRMALELYRLTDEEDYLHQAFGFAERSKAWALHELLRDAAAKAEAGIPAAVLEQERTLKRQLMGYDAQILQAAGQPTMVAGLKAEKYRLKSRFDRWIDSLELHYPKYHQAKYQLSYASLHEVQQQLLQNDQALIEYFWGANSVYAFVICRDTFVVRRLGDTPALAGQVREFYTLLQQPQQVGPYRQLAFKLYQQLLLPLQQAVGGLPRRWLVVPDGMLGYLPFDALLLTESGHSPKNLQYVINNYTVSYANSASLLREIQTRPRQRLPHNFLGVGPEFGPPSPYSLLAYSREELKEIRQTLKGGTLLLGTQARRDRFMQLASQYRVLHVSSHAAVDDADPLASWIAFWEDDSAVAQLQVRDLYGMQLPADMAVLGACQTAYGHIQQGEGIMSLARGFTYAGCRSLITTLWESNHWSTHQLMQQLYVQLAAGHTKDEALRQAKLAYIYSEQVDKQAAHPYYWAAPVAIGEMKPLDLDAGFSWLWSLAGLAILVAGYGAWRRVRRS